MKQAITLDAVELQSGLTRVNWAEGLIVQLPKEHEGRNSWLLNYGVSEEAIKLREGHNKKVEENGGTPRELIWSDITDSLNSVN